MLWNRFVHCFKKSLSLDFAFRSSFRNQLHLIESIGHCIIINVKEVTDMEKIEQFNLKKDEIARLKKKFHELQEGRQTLSVLIDGYIAEYRKSLDADTGKIDLACRKRKPKFKKLVFDEKGIYYSTFEIAVALGRNRSSITRTLVSMNKSKEWRNKLAPLQKKSRASNGDLITIYHEDIIGLILDHYEEEYLLRFSNPRRGDPSYAPNIQELRRFWDYLKSTDTPHGNLIQSCKAQLRQDSKYKTNPDRLYRH